VSVVGGTIAVGTSGWSYDHWDGAFYPDDLPPSRRLEFYVTRFPAVEVNYSFYRLPSARTVQTWRATAPDGFRFALKGSRYITHVLRLRNAEDPVRAFVERAVGLKEHLGPVLWQLPPDLSIDLELLDAFLGMLPQQARHAIEFRNKTWLAEEVFTLLRRHGAAYVCVSSEHMPAAKRATADFVYARFHGLDTGYDYDYTDGDLKPWAGFLAEQSAEGSDGYAFFNNDAHANAPRDAHALAQMLGVAAAHR
jgi:uncharacterized protein YecE (DUF72 family)